MTDFRALCAELVDELEDWIAYGDEADCADAHAIVDRARSALAQPEPQGPTDEELESFLVDVACQNGNMYHAEPMTLARAILARWGRPAIEPVPVTSDAAFAIGQTGGQPSEAERLAFEAWMRGHSWLVAGKWNGTTYVDPQERHSSVNVPAMQTRMLWAAWRDRATLACPAIEPVPVVERPWEREGWCNADGKCWAGYPELQYSLGETGDFDVCDPEWQLVDPRSLINTRLPIVLLPHHALPVPQQEADHG